MNEPVIADALRKLAQTAIDLSKQYETLEALLLEANEVCRSAYQVAARGGKETNWPALTQRIGDALDRQHAVLHPTILLSPAPASPRAEGEWKPIETAPKDGRQTFLAWFKPGYVAHVYLTTPEPPLAQTFRHYGGPAQGQQAGWPTHWRPLPAPPLVAEKREKS